MSNKEDAKQQIVGLIEKYNKVKEENRVNGYNEEMTKKDFILPLFRILGWNIEDSSEVAAEENVSKKRVDYGFRINGILKFFLEAKSLKENLDNPDFIKQAIDYSWLKGCTWAVLTNFVTIKIFNAEWKSSEPFQSHLKTISYQEFLDRFDELWLLSKESFEQGLLDKEAEKWGKRTKRIPVDKQLLADFTRFRELLSKSITKLNQNKNLTEEELDDSVQKILDRLIFIRNCEDRGYEEKTLLSNLREWESKGKGQLIEGLREVFGYFGKQYNSEIFRTNLCDSLEIDNDVLHEIIEGLYYTKDKSASYDFSAIEADVLGNIYEQYLGHILKKGEKRTKLLESRVHRKEQGIYYTPTYIVDYIVRNTLGELLKNTKVDPEKIRVLDPACGSGSFLLKAFDILNEYYKEHDKNYSQAQLDTTGTGTTYSRKLKILQNNIFGVDLDEQAVEIARLNLLLKIAEKGQRLPLLQKNIKCGNSLIDDPMVAGDKAFMWEEGFEEIIKEGGFDIIIGNPPYGAELKPVEKKYLHKKYPLNKGRLDTSLLFIERSLGLLKEDGFLGFIVPVRWLVGTYAKELRKFILKSTTIRNIVYFPSHVFEEAAIDTVIIIIQKGKRKQNTIVDVVKELPFKNLSEIKFQQDEWDKGDFEFYIFLDKNSKAILDHIELVKTPLKNMCKGFLGIQAYKKASDRDKFGEFISTTPAHGFEPELSGEHINRYSINWRGNLYIKYSKKLYNVKESRFFKQPKIVIRRILKDRVIAALDSDGYYTSDMVYNLISIGKDIDLKFILAILNSKLISFYYTKKNYDLSATFPKLRVNAFQKIPIPILSKTQQQPFILLVDKILSLNKHLNETDDKETDERAKIEEEIKKTDEKIDELVYQIYGITEEEKKIIEATVC